MTRPLLFVATLLLAASAAFADWTPVADGVDYQEFAQPGIDIHVARIDLTSSSIRVISTRESERATKVSDYAKKNKALVAINGDYFDDHFHPIGLTIGPCGQWQGTKDTKREGVVAIGEEKAEVRTQSDVMDPPADWIQTAVSGWPMLVRDCKALTAKELPGSDVFTRAPQPRTAVGVSDDGKTMYLVVADGRRTGVPGVTLAQLGTFMTERLHVCSAINLDGGGSSAMWVGDAIVNRPADGVERKVSDHLAVVSTRDFVACTPEDRLAANKYAAVRAADEAAKAAADARKKGAVATITTVAPMASGAAAPAAPATTTTTAPAATDTTATTSTTAPPRRR